MKTENWKYWSAPSSINVWKCGSSWHFIKTNKGDYIAGHFALTGEGDELHGWNKSGRTRGRALRRIRRFLNANKINFA